MVDGFASAMYLIQTDNHCCYGNWCRDYQNPVTNNGLKAIKTGQSAVINDYDFSTRRLDAIIQKPDTGLNYEQKKAVFGWFSNN